MCVCLCLCVCMDYNPFSPLTLKGILKQVNDMHLVLGRPITKWNE